VCWTTWLVSSAVVSNGCQKPRVHNGYSVSLEQRLQDLFIVNHHELKKKSYDADEKFERYWHNFLGKEDNFGGGGELSELSVLYISYFRMENTLTRLPYCTLFFNLWKLIHKYLLDTILGHAQEDSFWLGVMDILMLLLISLIALSKCQDCALE